VKNQSRHSRRERSEEGKKFKKGGAFRPATGTRMGKIGLTIGEGKKRGLGGKDGVDYR